MKIETVREVFVNVGGRFLGLNGNDLSAADKKALEKLAGTRRLDALAKYALAKKAPVENVRIDGGTAAVVGAFLGTLAPENASLRCVGIAGLIDTLSARAARRLKSLSLEALDDDDVPSPLGKLTSLERLTLDSWNLQPAFIAAALKAPPASLSALALTSGDALDLSRTRWPEAVRELELSAQEGITLGTLPPLTRAKFFSARGTIEGLVGLERLETLIELDVHGAAPAPVKLQKLGGLTRLRLCEATGAGFEALTKLEDLMLLPPEGKSIDLKSLTGLTQLTSLYVSGPAPKDFKPLAKLTALKMVNFSDQWAPTAAQLEVLSGRGIEVRDSKLGSGPVDALIKKLKKKK